MAKKVQLRISERGKYIKEDLLSILRGLGDVVLAAALLYFADIVEVIDVSSLGQYAPIVVGALAWCAKALRKLASRTTYAE